MTLTAEQMLEIRVERERNRIRGAQALITQWTKQGEKYVSLHADGYYRGQGAQFLKCAKELARVLE